MADLNKLLTDISRSIVDDPDGVTVTEISNVTMQKLKKDK